MCGGCRVPGRRQRPVTPASTAPSSTPTRSTSGSWQIGSGPTASSRPMRSRSPTGGRPRPWRPVRRRSTPRPELPHPGSRRGRGEEGGGRGRRGGQRVTDQPNPTPETGVPVASHGESEFQPAFDRPLTPKERMTIDRTDMPEQDALQRAANFREVNLGYSEQPPCLEAERCLQCKNGVCVDGCPVGVDIPGFIELLRVGDMAGAADPPRRQRPARRHRPRLPAGDPVRGGLHPRRKKGRRRASAHSSGSWPIGRWRTAREPARRSAVPPPTGQARGRRRCGPAGLTRGRRAGAATATRSRSSRRCTSRRRARLRHPRVPAARRRSSSRRSTRSRRSA